MHASRHGKSCIPRGRFAFSIKHKPSNSLPKFAHLASFLRINDRGSTETTRICPVKLGNLLRTELMALYGGVYADTSICPMRPLEDYLGKLVGPPEKGSGFFVPPLFRLAGAMNHSQLQQYKMCHIRGKAEKANQQMAFSARMVDNFFMVARLGTLIMQRWMQAYYQHLLQVLVHTTPSDQQQLNLCVDVMPYFIHQCTFTRQVLQDAEF